MSLVNMYICILSVILLGFTEVICNTNVSYTGRLSPECVELYYQMYVTHEVPPRDYLYFHETRSPELLSQVDTETNPSRRIDITPIRWRIVGGKKISIEDAPYQVLYGLYCGGSLIAPHWVLTAAHCKDKETFIIAGSTLRSQGTRYPICAHFFHPMWKIKDSLHPHDYDYQLVLLETPVPVTPSSRPIVIGSVNDVRPGEMVAISGWGHTQYKQRAMQDHLQRVYVPIMQHETCASLPLNDYKLITPRMFCAGLMNGTKDSCQGDSGGPAVYQGKLLGLVSFGVGCAFADQPGVYNIVPLARGWIRSVTGLPL